MTLSQFLNIGQEYINWFKGALYAGASFLALDTDVFHILVLLMLVDTFTGAIKSIILNRNFSFKTLFWGLLTKVGVLLLPVTLALLAKGLSFDFRWLVVVVMNILLISEAFSILTNMLSIKQRKDIQNVDFISLILAALRKGLKNVVDKLIKKIEEAE